MSDDQGPAGQSTPTPPPPRRRSTVVSVLMVLGGIILLFPGLCSLFFMSGMPGGAGGWVALWAICFAISAGGLVMIVKAFR